MTIVLPENQDLANTYYLKAVDCIRSQKVSIPILIIGGLLSLGISAFVGDTLITTIGAVRGVALMGFALLLTMPISIGITFLQHHLLRNTTTKEERLKNDQNFSKLASLVHIFVLVAGLAASQLICNSLFTSPPFSYTDALEFYGIQLGISVAIPIALAITCGVCCCPCVTAAIVNRR